MSALKLGRLCGDLGTWIPQGGTGAGGCGATCSALRLRRVSSRALRSLRSESQSRGQPRARGAEPLLPRPRPGLFWGSSPRVGIQRPQKTGHLPAIPGELGSQLSTPRMRMETGLCPPDPSRELCRAPGLDETPEGRRAHIRAGGHGAQAHGRWAGQRACVRPGLPAGLEPAVPAARAGRALPAGGQGHVSRHARPTSAQPGRP